jgi:hypothetical protein
MMANENNHGGARPGAGRKLIERLTLQIDLGKATPSGNLDGLTMPELHGRRRQRQDALAVVGKCREMLESLGIQQNTELDGLALSFEREVLELGVEIDTRAVSAAPYTRAAFQREFEINALVAQARNRIKNGQADVLRKQTELEKAGVTDVTIPPYEASSDIGEISALEAEAAQWAKFQQSYLVRDLPENASEAVMLIGTYGSVAA